MSRVTKAYRWMVVEAEAMERRLEGIPAFAATIPMVAAAAPVPTALEVADQSVGASKRLLRHRLQRFRVLMAGSIPSSQRLAGVHRSWIALRGQFDDLLSTVDVFADALTQRAEHGIGTLLRGLDRLAVDGLRTAWPLFRCPPLVCYLDAGFGGAIRRAFTRLPDGSPNGVALIKVPRERVFSASLASLLHEVGHQGAALLELVPAFKGALWVAAARGRLSPDLASYWTSKASETVPDAWAVCKLGAAASVGLFATFGRSPRFAFHDPPGDPHPMPWLRALVSVELGARILPDPIWRELRELWLTLYPLERALPAVRPLAHALAESVPVVADILARFRPPRLGGGTLAEALGAAEVHPRLLTWPAAALSRRRTTACAAVAAVGLAKYRGLIRPRQEHDLIARALTHRPDDDDLPLTLSPRPVLELLN